jgi:dUTP pyrophosphatase
MCQTAGKMEYQVYNESNKVKARPLYDFTGKKHLVHVGPGERAAIPTGIIMDIPKGHSVRIHSRSGLAFKNGLVLVNGEGVVDSDFVDEVMLLVLNVSRVGITIGEGDRIAQAELIQNLPYEIVQITERPTIKTDRIGGFGSTGVTLDNVTAIEENRKEVPVSKRGRERPSINRN